MGLVEIRRYDGFDENINVEELLSLYQQQIKTGEDQKTVRRLTMI